MQTYIDCGTSELFYPFKKYLPEVKYFRVERRSVGFEQWEIDVTLLNKDEEIIEVDMLSKETIKELDSLASLWKQPCFNDWLPNVGAQAIFSNMRGTEATEMV